jgi:hypothetical protein
LELSALRRVSDFLAEHCTPDVQHCDADALMRVFPTAEITVEAKRLFDDVLAVHPHLFYVHYLLGVWHREQSSKFKVQSSKFKVQIANASYFDDPNGFETDDAKHSALSTLHFELAFDFTDCVVICPVMMLDEQSGEVVPVRESRFPFGVTTKHRSEQWGDVTLWYPAVETDQHGLLCLPVYREMIADPAFQAVDANGTRFTVETFGLRDIAKPYRFGMYDPVVLSGEQHSQLTCPPGLEEELRYAKRQVFANLSLDDAAALGALGIIFTSPGQFQIEDGGVIMPVLRYADEFAGLHFRGLTRTELTQKLRKYRNEHDPTCQEQAPALTSLTVADGDNFIVSLGNGRTYLCRFFASNTPQQTGVLDVWDLGWIRRGGYTVTAACSPRPPCFE